MSSRGRRTRPGAIAAGVAAAVLAAGAGCGSQDPCAEDISPCGGSIAGQWEVAGQCRDPFYRPPLPVTYLDQPKGTARELPPEATSSDWCSYMKFEPTGAITNFIFPNDTLVVSGGTVTYAGATPYEGTYAGLLAATGKGSVELAAACLTQFGANPDCATLQTALVDYAESTPAFSNIRCVPAPDAACACSYDIRFDVAVNGRWNSPSDGLLNQFDDTERLPAQVDYCTAGGGASLTIWGHNRSSIWEQPGLRKLELRRLGP
jgi:hypothetical protein